MKQTIAVVPMNGGEKHTRRKKNGRNLSIYTSISVLCGVAMTVLSIQFVNTKQTTSRIGRKLLEPATGSTVILERVDALVKVVHDLDTCKSESNLVLQSDCANYQGDIHDLPGVTHLGKSVNFVTGERRSLFILDSYANCKESSIGYERVKLPDGVDNIVVKQEEYLAEAASESSSASSVMEEKTKSLSGTFKLSVSNLFTSFKMSASFSSSSQWMSEQSQRSARKFSQVEHLVQEYTYELHPKQNLHSDTFKLVKDIDDLIAINKAEEAEALGVEFVYSYGTHIMTREPMGGYYEMVMSFESSAYERFQSESSALKGCLEMSLQHRAGVYSGSIEASACYSKENSEKIQNELEVSKSTYTAFTEPPFKGERSDDNAVTFWKQKITDSPQPIAPWIGNELRGEYDSTPIYRIGYFLQGNQLQSIRSSLEDLETTLYNANRKYLSFYNPTNCGNVCGYGGEPVVEAKYDPDVGYPFVEPEKYCKCVCTDQKQGVYCDVEPKQLLSSDEIKSLVYEKCRFTISHWNGAHGPIHDITHNLGPNTAIDFDISSDLNERSKLGFNIFCDQTCTSSKEEDCEEGSSHMDALTSLGDLCLNIGWNRVGGTQSAETGILTCASEDNLEEMEFPFQVEGDSRFFYQAFLKPSAAYSQAREVLKELQLYTSGYDGFRQSGEVAFDGETCNIIDKQAQLPTCDMMTINDGDDIEQRLTLEIPPGGTDTDKVQENNLLYFKFYFKD